MVKTLTFDTPPGLTLMSTRVYYQCVCWCSGCQTSVDKSSSGRVTLGEQAAALQNPHDRVMALRRVTAAAQVLLARTMVMRALSLLSVR